MKDEKKLTEQDIEHAQVRLPPIAGLQPRTWLPVLLALLTALLLFLVLVLPGLRHRGAYLSCRGYPAAAAVYEGEHYLGDTSTPFFISRGEHLLSIRKQGFRDLELKVIVPGPVFATLFFRPSVSVTYSLDPESPASVLNPSFAEFLDWSLSGNPSKVYQIPRPLTDAVLDLVSAANPASIRTGAMSQQILRAGMAASTNPASARDSVGAALVAAAPGGSFTGTLATARAALALLASSSQSQQWIRANASGTLSSSILTGLASDAAPSSGNKAPVKTGSLSAAGHVFVLFSAGTCLMAGETSQDAAPYEIRVPAFGIAATEVTRRQYAAFLAANPYWRRDNLETLLAAGLVDEDYLADFNASAPDEHPVTQISWHAAMAYCEWLTSFLPPGYRAVLPTEAMWESAAAAGLQTLRSSAGGSSILPGIFKHEDASGPARVSSTGADRNGISDIFGNVWEWTSDTYMPFPGLLVSEAGSLPGTAPADSTLMNLLAAGKTKVVRGGSWANAAEKVTLGMRGPVPASHGSEFLGFRPAIVLP
ncbi:MAG: formylglycine-generating enzyme family protein [Rectinemataceae bacterium]|nr:formylglycine-generating enzyme family protein [Spirochaetaceae bacterium]